jgi:DMSO/TMAO reductase YedYZ molybdopterin-dependent catalytic subunit
MPQGRGLRAAQTMSEESAGPRTGLRLVSAEPLNAETALAEQAGGITPNSRFYLRNHFAIPQIERGIWQLSVSGEVERSLRLTYGDLRALPHRTLLTTMECAGNGRAYMDPRPDGEPWRYGAVSAAEWTGVPLVAVLGLASLRATAREIAFEGADSGYVHAVDQTMAYARSMPVEKALHPDTLLAWAMNGDELPVEHGFPLRLIVPGWYGMASVKWLTRIEACAERFSGFFQRDRYILEKPSGPSGVQVVPLTRMAPRSLIIDPLEGAALAPGVYRIRGLAWSGAGPVTRVEVSVDDGATWARAQFTSASSKYFWRCWEYTWDAGTVGEATLSSRVYDARGNIQPSGAVWNRLGYANNAVERVRVSIG